MLFLNKRLLEQLWNILPNQIIPRKKEKPLSFADMSVILKCVLGAFTHIVHKPYHNNDDNNDNNDK